MEHDTRSSLDATDEQILELLWLNSRISFKEIGSKVHLTGQAVKNRLERLADLGVVERYTVKLNCPVYGYRTHVLVQVNIQLPGKTKFTDFIQQRKYHIERCYQITGKQAYFIDGYFRHDSELKQFLEDISVFGTYEIQTVLSDVPLVKLEE